MARRAAPSPAVSRLLRRTARLRPCAGGLQHSGEGKRIRDLCKIPPLRSSARAAPPGRCFPGSTIAKVRGLLLQLLLAAALLCSGTWASPTPSPISGAVTSRPWFGFLANMAVVRHQPVADPLWRRLTSTYGEPFVGLLNTACWWRLSVSCWYARIGFVVGIARLSANVVAVVATLYEAAHENVHSSDR